MITEMKNSLQCLNRFELAEKKISTLEHRSREMIQSEEQRKNNKEKLIEPY